MRSVVATSRLEHRVFNCGVAPVERRAGAAIVNRPARRHVCPAGLNIPKGTYDMGVCERLS